MKIICVSDTHGRHRSVKINTEADVLVFAGDYSGAYVDTRGFVEWVNKAPCKDKIIVRGNHDYYHTELEIEVQRYDNIHILHDSSICIQDKMFYGTPWTKRFLNWSYMASEKVLEKIYSLIPVETQILISHNPAFGRMDTVASEPIGSPSLRKIIDEKLVNLQLHVFGHVHERSGFVVRENYISVNASMPSNGRGYSYPYVVEIE